MNDNGALVDMYADGGFESEGRGDFGGFQRTAAAQQPLSSSTWQPTKDTSSLASFLAGQANYALNVPKVECSWGHQEQLKGVGVGGFWSDDYNLDMGGGGETRHDMAAGRDTGSTSLHQHGSRKAMLHRLLQHHDDISLRAPGRIPCSGSVSDSSAASTSPTEPSQSPGGYDSDAAYSGMADPVGVSKMYPTLARSSWPSSAFGSVAVSTGASQPLPSHRMMMSSNHVI